MFLLSSRRTSARASEKKKEANMRSLTGALVAALMLSVPAFAAEAEGQIQTVDRDNLTITLENGKSYKLPGEFDVDASRKACRSCSPTTRSATRT